MLSVQIVSSDKDCGIASYGNVVLVDLRGELSLGHVRAIGEAYRRLRGQHATLVTLVLASAGVPLAGPEVRAEGALIGRETASFVARVAIVFEDRGLVAQIMRTAIRGFSITARNTPLQVYEDRRLGIDGIRRFVPEDLRSDLEQQLTRALEQLRKDGAS